MKFLKKIYNFFTRYSIGKNESIRPLPITGPTEEEYRKIFNDYSN